MSRRWSASHNDRVRAGLPTPWLVEVPRDLPVGRAIEELLLLTRPPVRPSSFPAPAPARLPGLLHWRALDRPLPPWVAWRRRWARRRTRKPSASATLPCGCVAAPG